MMFQDLKVIAFDCDGVMFDSSAANQAYYNHILEHFELPVMTASQNAFVHMHTVHESLNHLFGHVGLNEAAEAFRRQIKPLHFIRLMTIEPYLVAFLERIRGRYHAAVATNRVDTMDQVLREHDLEGRFDLVVTAADVPLAKPHPDMLLAIRDHFNIDVRQMIYIGDSSIDQIAAQQAGIPFVAFANAQLEAEIHVDNLARLAELIVPGN